MWRGRTHFKWGMGIALAVLMVLLFGCGVAVQQVKPKLLNTAERHMVKYTQYVKETQAAYELIQNQKKETMLATVIDLYRKEHPPKIQTPPPSKDTEKPGAGTFSPPPKQTLPSGKSVVYLTIDDGPSAATASIVKTLNQYKVTATFFMLEPNLRRYPSIVKTLAQDGFGLGLHGVTHDKNKFYQSTKTVVGEMKADQATLQQITGIKTDLIRVPYGSVPYMTLAERNAEVAAGFIMWDWNIDSRDWDYKDQRYVASTIQQLKKVEAANECAVILIHDRPETAKYLPQLLDYLKSNHYDLRKIDDSVPPVQFRPR